MPASRPPRAAPPADTPGVTLDAPAESPDCPGEPGGREAHRVSRRGHFADPAVTVRSWYVAADSRDVRRGEVRTIEMLNRRIALYRDLEGVVHAVDARCPHLGADLGMGRVVEDGLRCAFHHWCFGHDGSCRRAPGQSILPRRRVRAYPTLERWGLIWLFNGPRPLFEMPDAPHSTPYRVLRMRSRLIRCHPHLVVGNGLDALHFEALHDIVFAEPPRVSVEEPYRVTLEMRGRPRSRWLQRLTGSLHQDIHARFITIGASLAWAAIEAPVRFDVVFTGSPTPEGGCRTRTLFLLPAGSPAASIRALALMYTLLRDDVRMLERLDFSPDFTEADAGMRAFARLVNAMEVG